MQFSRVIGKLLTASLMALCVCIGVLIGAELLHTPLPLTSFSQSPITITPASVDFGTIADGVIGTKTLTLENRTNTPVEITSAGTSCGCTKAICPREIPPHASVPLTIRYNSQGASGDVRESVMVILADKQNTHQDIPVAVHVIQALAVSPRSVDLGMSATAHQTISLARLDGLPLSISQIEAPQGVSVHSRSAASRVTLDVSKSQGETPEVSGDHDESLVVKTDDPQMPVVTIPVSWSIPSHFQVVPKAIPWGIVRANVPLKASVTIYQAAGSLPNPQLVLDHTPTGLSASVTTISKPGRGNVSFLVAVTGSLRACSELVFSKMCI